MQNLCILQKWSVSVKCHHKYGAETCAKLAKVVGSLFHKKADFKLETVHGYLNQSGNRSNNKTTLKIVIVFYKVSALRWVLSALYFCSTILQMWQIQTLPTNWKFKPKNNDLFCHSKDYLIFCFFVTHERFTKSML